MKISQSWQEHRNNRWVFYHLGFVVVVVVVVCNVSTPAANPFSTGPQWVHCGNSKASNSLQLLFPHVVRCRRDRANLHISAADQHRLCWRSGWRENDALKHSRVAGKLSWSATCRNSSRISNALDQLICRAPVPQSRAARWSSHLLYRKLTNHRTMGCPTWRGSGSMYRW